MQYHFWDKETHFKAETNPETKPKWYNVWRTEGSSLIKPLDLKGEEQIIEIPSTNKCTYGVIQEFLPIHRIKEKVLLRQIINNLISDPDIIFCKDERIKENIKKVWDFIAEEFKKQKVSINKENPLCFIIGNWSFSPKSYKKIRKEFLKALKRKKFTSS